MRIAAFLISLFVAAPALAGTRAGVTLPDTLTVGDQRLVLNGMGLREATFLDIDVYVAGLYVEQRSADPRQILAPDRAKVIVLKFKRDVDRSDIVKAWNDGFAGNATVPLASLKPKIDQLNAWMPKVNDGDTIAFVYQPGVGVSVDINGVRKGTIEGPDFATSLFSIWLGPKPPGGALKRGLLGG